MRTLVVAAHPDDEVLGCGGTMARLVGEGEEVHVLILSDGETSRYDSPAEAPGEVIERRREAARQAAKVLGVASLTMLEHPDNRFDAVPLLELTKAIEAVVRDSAPDTVLTHHSGDMNIDHRRVAQAVLTATRPLPGGVVRQVYAFEVLSSSHAASGHFGAPFVPNTFVDISGTIESKLDAMRCYDQELRPFPHPRSLEAIRSLAVTRGTACGLSSAEAFILVREVKTNRS